MHQTRAMTGAEQNLVRQLRDQVVERLNRQRLADQTSGRTPMTAQDERQFARSLIVQALSEQARHRMATGHPPLSAQEEEQLAASVHDAVFSFGRLQQVLGDPLVDTLDINGCDRVFVGYADGRQVAHGPVADSDDELIEAIHALAAELGSGQMFDAAHPEVELRLRDGSRLTALMGVCSRPSVSLRRARLGKVTLADLVGTGTMSQDVAAFLRAAVRARKNIVIAGAGDAGKTTLLRALAYEVAPGERLVSVEREPEIGLEFQADLHPNVVALRERPAGLQGAVAVGSAELIDRALRMNPGRLIIGELVGEAVVPALNAMSEGQDGVITTIRAGSAIEVVNRICGYALRAPQELPVPAARLLIAGALDFVVFVRRRNEYDTGGGLVRRVETIHEITGVDAELMATEVFSRGPAGYAVPHAPIRCLDDLLAVGYSPQYPAAGR